MFTTCQGLFFNRRNTMSFGGAFRISIDQARPFSPRDFLGQGLSVRPDDLYFTEAAIDEEDDQSLLPPALNVTSLSPVNVLDLGEIYIDGEERLRRLKKEKFIRLGVKVFRAFWENTHLIPVSWGEKTDDAIIIISFDGTIFRSPYGSRFVPCLYRSEAGWSWCPRSLEAVWSSGDLSVVLARSGV
jgi:hypothetical protein